MKIKYKKTTVFNKDEIYQLYSNVGWTSYTNNMEQLILALKKSLEVYGAFDGDKLIGLLRIVGDKHTIIYIQDLLVLKSYQRKGIASELLHIVLAKYKHVRQICLMSDDTIELRKFYNQSNFHELEKMKAVGYMYYKK